MIELCSFVVLLLLNIPRVVLTSSCPSPRELYPCSCNATSGQFECGNTITSGLVLKQIFQESSRQIHGELLLNKFTFQSSIVDQIESDTFDKFSFREILIGRNDYLNHIDKNAFRSTYNITDKVHFESNPSIGTTKDSTLDFFQVLSKFSNASLIYAIDCGLQYIPENAFRPLLGVQSRLQRLSFARNRIKSIGDFAFSNLPNINFLNLKENLLDTLSKLSLTLSESEQVILIDLSKNSLNSSSFNSQPLSSIGRPFDLHLSDNSITYLNESIFKPLFKRSITIKLWRNPVNCSDCLMKWTSNEKRCQPSNNTISYAQRIEFQCKLFKESFRRCQNQSFISDEYNESPLSCPLISNSLPISEHNYILFNLIFIISYTKTLSYIF